MELNYIIYWSSLRWFFKYHEVSTLFTLKDAVIKFQEDFATPERLEEIEDKDWDQIEEYIDAIKPFVTASKLLGGENYPTASSVIPFLDEVRCM